MEPFEEFSDVTLRARRKRLIDSLRNKGIRDERVLKAMEILPREFFVLPSFKNKAYDDVALPIEAGQTISQPYTVAYMTSLLNPQKNEKILEIGTGSGYQAALLNLLGAEVYSVERIKELFEKAKERFELLNLDIKVANIDGSLGWEEFAPYDKIIIAAASPELPKSLFRQLKIGGIAVAPIGGKSSQKMKVFKKLDEELASEKTYDSFRFVPLIGEEGWKSRDW